MRNCASKCAGVEGGGGCICVGYVTLGDVGSWSAVCVCILCVCVCVCVCVGGCVCCVCVCVCPNACLHTPALPLVTSNGPLGVPNGREHSGLSPDSRIRIHTLTARTHSRTVQGVPMRQDILTINFFCSGL
jgi:hypothetical protein